MDEGQQHYTLQILTQNLDLALLRKGVRGLLGGKVIPLTLSKLRQNCIIYTGNNVH